MIRLNKVIINFKSNNNKFHTGNTTRLLLNSQLNKNLNFSTKTYLLDDEVIHPKHFNLKKGTVLDSYYGQIGLNQLKSDPFQLEVVTQLDDLYKSLLDYKPRGLEKVKHKGDSKGIVSSFMKGLFHKEELDKPKQIEKVQLKSIYLFGTVGTGKTMLMDLFYEALPDNLPKKRVHFHAFMMEIHSRIHQFKKQAGKKGVQDPIKLVCEELLQTSWLICFDELQVTDIADAMILRQLFFELMDLGIVLMITSNRHPTELYKNGIQRQSFVPCIDLLLKECEVIDLNSGLDYRKQNEDSGQLYFILDKGSNKQVKMDELFNVLTKDHSVVPGELKVLGRTLKLEKTSSVGICRCNFSELCEDNLNAADYLTLAQKYPIVFLDKVPKIDLNDKNVARRFITLIDALYEYKNILVISSEYSLDALFSQDSPTPIAAQSISIDPNQAQDDLIMATESIFSNSSNFSGEEEFFAFSRAMSRLYEMQGWRWIQRNPLFKMAQGKIDL